MASYLPEIQDVIVPPPLFTPNLDFLNKGIQVMTQKWALANQKASILYNSYFKSDLTLDENIKEREKYANQIKDSLDELASKNLADPLVMKEFEDKVSIVTKDNHIMVDMAYTDMLNKNFADAELLKLTIPTKENGYKTLSADKYNGFKDLTSYIKAKVDRTQEGYNFFSYLYHRTKDIGMYETNIDKWAADEADNLYRIDKTGGGNNLPSFQEVDNEYIKTHIGGKGLMAHELGSHLINTILENGAIKKEVSDKSFLRTFTLLNTYKGDWSAVYKDIADRIEHANARSLEIVKDITEKENAIGIYRKGVVDKAEATIASTQATIKDIHEHVGYLEYLKRLDKIIENSNQSKDTVIKQVKMSEEVKKKINDKQMDYMNGALKLAEIWGNAEAYNKMYEFASIYADQHHQEKIDENKAFLEKMKIDAQKAQEDIKNTFSIGTTQIGSNIGYTLKPTNENGTHKAIVQYSIDGYVPDNVTKTLTDRYKTTYGSVGYPTMFIENVDGQYYTVFILPKPEKEGSAMSSSIMIRRANPAAINSMQLSNGSKIIIESNNGGQAANNNALFSSEVAKSLTNNFDVTSTGINEQLKKDNVDSSLFKSIFSSDTDIGKTRITSDYGYRWKDGKLDFHEGIDIGVNENTPLLAPVDNMKVIDAGFHKDSGNYVILEDPNGYRVSYSHLNDININIGDIVSKGDIVGLSGRTGNVTGPHLHLRVKQKIDNNTYKDIDPSIYFSNLNI